MSSWQVDDKPLRLIFAGTPDFAVPCLAACQRTGFEVIAVYTQPDRRAGRGRKLSPSPVKQAALAAGFVVEQPESLRSTAAQQTLASHRPDLLVVVAYGLILPRAVLAVPTCGCWNVHASLLPRWRGAAPIQRAILAGDGATGVALMRMEAGLDTGPVMLERSTSISPTDTGGSLQDRLSLLGAQLLGEGLAHLRSGHAPAARPQAADGVTYARKLDKSEAPLDFERTASELERQVRAFDPWPGATAQIAGEMLHIWGAQALPLDHRSAPGSVLMASRAGIDIACAQGALRVSAMQRAGGRRITAGDYLNARPELRHTA